MTCKISPIRIIRIPHPKDGKRRAILQWGTFKIAYFNSPPSNTTQTHVAKKHINYE